MTAQIRERLVLDGEATTMAFCPPLPVGHPRVVAAAVKAADRMLQSTACWRGYQGTWAVADGKFYLTGLRGNRRLVGDEPLLADWFTGVLRVPRGELLQYVHMGFGSVFEEEVHIKVEAGVVTARQTIDNRGKPHDRDTLGQSNLPGGENRFAGDDKL